MIKRKNWNPTLSKCLSTVFSHCDAYCCNLSSSNSIKGSSTASTSFNKISLETPSL